MPGLTAEQAATALRAAAAAFPALAHVRRERRRHALGNGGGEATVGERSLLPDEAEAALVLDAHSVPGKGTRQTVTVASCLAPLALADLAAAGVCTTRVAEPAWDGEALTAQREHCYAGRVVASEPLHPGGPEAREAAARLILADELLAPAGSRLRDDLEAWALYVALGHADGAVPEAHEWLVARLERLGVETGEDVALLEPADLRLDGVPAWEREAFDERYPREVHLPDLHMRIHYHVRRREVVAEKVGGIRRGDPKRWELPAWPGWRVKFQRASRVVEIR